MSPPKHPPGQLRRITGQEDRTLTGMTVHRQQEDGALIAAIARRQQEALDQLYERYQAVVYHDLEGFTCDQVGERRLK